MSKITELENQIESYQKAISDLGRQIDQIKPTKQYKCPSCHKRSQVKNVMVVREMAYRPPYGCTGGAYWYFREYLIVCPKCGKQARAYGETSWNGRVYRENQINKKRDPQLRRFLFVQYYLNHFKEVLDWYPSDYESFNLDHIREQHKERERRNRY